MRPEEISALGDLAGEAAAATAAQIRELHDGIAKRVWSAVPSREIRFIETANHYFVCAPLSRDPESLAARMIGDLLVLRPSAWSHAKRTERLKFPVEHYHHVGGAHHFDLLNHPAIYEQIERWLSTRRPLAVVAGEQAVEPQRP